MANEELRDKQTDVSLFFDLSRTEYRMRIGRVTLAVTPEQLQQLLSFYEVLERERRFPHAS